MEFTEAEAKAKVGAWVRVQDGSLLHARLTRGTRGVVVGAQLSLREEGSTKERRWAVCLEFFLTADRSASVLLRDIDMEQYLSAFEEIPAERTPENVSSPEGPPLLEQHSRPARSS
jgi:hypothetical protein